MKTWNKLATMALLSIFLIACGDDDNGPTPTPQKMMRTFDKSADLPGYAESEVSTVAFEITLKDLIGEDAAHNFIKAERQIADCYIEVNGLKDKTPETILEDFSLQLNDNAPVLLGDCRFVASNVNDFQSDTKQSTEKVADFIKTVFQSYTGNTQSATVRASFTPTQDINRGEVSLRLVIKGDYYYNVYLDK